MSFKKHTFQSTQNQDFFSVLRQRVNNYFEQTGKTRYGNSELLLKTAAMFLLYFVPYFVLLFGGITNFYVSLGLWILVGLGSAGIGFCVMHDANHGSYSKKSTINKLMGYSMNLIGANAEIWKLQHNRLHHTYTNVAGVDDDINTPFVLRFSPHNKRFWIHKFQFLYAWFFYGLLTLSWFTSKEFIQLSKYKKMGLIRSKKERNRILTQLIVWKAIYYTYMLVIPLLVLPFPFWMTLIAFFTMHFTAGLALSMVFQTAHVMPLCDFPEADESGVIHNNWAVHELLTTSNYSPKSRIFTWFIGGLNYQVEHHLFPNVCHVHYKSISNIVRETTKEFDLPYNTQKNFLVALWNHSKMLYQLGRV